MTFKHLLQQTILSLLRLGIGNAVAKNSEILLIAATLQLQRSPSTNRMGNMGLEFTSRPDRQGAAAYFITDGSPVTERSLRQTAEEADTYLPDEAQVVLLDGKSREGVEIADFYDLTSLPAVLIVMDDDQVFHSWTTQMPTTQDVTYMMSQAGVPLRGDQQ